MAISNYSLLGYYHYYFFSYYNQVVNVFFLKKKIYFNENKQNKALSIELMVRSTQAWSLFSKNTTDGIEAMREVLKMQNSRWQPEGFLFLLFILK